MDRRNFLRASATMAVAGAVLAEGLDVADAGAETDRSKVRYRGTHNGKILQSHNGGKKWTLLTNFGSGYSIPKVGPDRNKRVIATLIYQRRSFDLALQPDHRTWRTI